MEVQWNRAAIAEQAFEKTMDNVVILSGMCDCRQDSPDFFQYFFYKVKNE